VAKVFKLWGEMQTFNMKWSLIIQEIQSTMEKLKTTM
jgi:hypothetical protein